MDDREGVDVGERTWRQVPDFPGYLISDDGQVWSVVRGRPLARPVDVIGRPRVTLWRDGRPRTFRVSTVVAAAFIGPRPPGAVVCHADGDPTHNAVANLRYDSSAANTADSVRHGTHAVSARTTCPRGHALGGHNRTPAAVRSGVRGPCLACRRAWADGQRRVRRGEVVADMFATADAHYARIIARP